nr:hypothetical protein GCM10020241_27080 [Streptoalloteichus tenebrarius]
MAVTHFGTSNETAFTPPLLTFQPAAKQDAHTLLLGLAETASRQPALSGQGAVHYSLARQWVFTSSRDHSGQHLGSRLGEYKMETWRNPDGTGRSLRAEQNPPPGSNPVVMDMPLRPSETTPTTSERSRPDQETLPPVGRADANSLRERLLAQDSNRTAGQWFEVAASIWGGRAGDPASAEALLRILADQPDIKAEGTTEDRSGRRAIAISTDGVNGDSRFPEQRQYLLIDPQTGFFLAREQVALAVSPTAGETVQTPATIGYYLWLKAALVSDTTTRPE